MNGCKLCRLAVLIAVLSGNVQTTSAQTHTRHIIYLKDKANSPYSLNNPQAFLSQRTIDKRQRYQLLTDSTDLPVSPQYLQTLAQTGAVTLLGASRWLNAVVVQCNDATLALINALPFVRKAQPIALRQAAVKRKQEPPALEGYRRVNSTTAMDYGAGTHQLQLHHGGWLHQLGATGNNVHIAVLDAGFAGFTTNPLLDSMLLSNRMRSTWDFVARNAVVADDHPHGLQCLTILAANQPGTLIGSAPQASYHLLRSEDAATEYPVEEFLWGLAVEYADSAGVDVIASSVGYYDFDDPLFNYTYAQMNGRTTLISGLAALAARKGILVVNSAGNEGSSYWKYMIAPADADSVLSVGAVDANGTIAPFSSFGPTADGRTKPDVLALGWGTALGTPSGTVTNMSGTSFAAPVVAGLAACLWQLFPEENNISLLQSIRRAGNRYSAPHPQYGFGVPDMRAAMGQLLQKEAMLGVVVQNCSLQINWRSKDAAGMQYRLQWRVKDADAWSTLATKQVSTAGFAQRQYEQTEPLPPAHAASLQLQVVQVLDTNQATLYTVPLDSLTISIPPACTTTAVSGGNNPVYPFKVVPNPGPELLLQLSAPLHEWLQVVVSDINGRVLLHKTLHPGGARQLHIATPAWAPGRYPVQLYLKGRLLGRANWIKL